MGPEPIAACRRRVLATALALACSACAVQAPPAPAPTHATLYERIGGMPAITAIVDGAVRNIATDPRINRRFAGSQHGALTQNLAELLCLRAGGPCTYRGRDMASAHEGMQIRDDEFDALVEDIARSLDTLKVGAPEKAELLAIAGQMRGAVVGH